MAGSSLGAIATINGKSYPRRQGSQTTHESAWLDIVKFNKWQPRVELKKFKQHRMSNTWASSSLSMKRFALTSLIMFELIGEIHYVLIEKIRIWQKKKQQQHPNKTPSPRWVLLDIDE